MPGIRDTFVRSRLGRKIFLTFLLIIAVPLICISLLSREISDFVLMKSTDQLLRDSTKSVALNLLDRMRSAEALLRILDSTRASDTGHAEVAARSALVFSQVSRGPSLGALAPGESQVHVTTDPATQVPEVSIEIAGGNGRPAIQGVLNSKYLWENLESAFYTLCVGGAEFSVPYCHGAEAQAASTARSERALYFRPYLEAKPWTLQAVASPDIADYLPIKLGALFAYVAASALLIALSASAFFVRRATTPLDALITATNAIRSGDFTHAIPLTGMKDEFRDVAESFNVMSATIGADVAFMKMLSTIDVAILERRPLAEIVECGMRHFAEHGALRGMALSVTDALEGSRVTYRIEESGRMSSAHARTDAAGPDAPPPPDASAEGRVATRTARLALPAAATTDAQGRLAAELRAFESRIAVAINAQEHERTLVARAARDSLTRLLNRLGLVERLDQLTAHHGPLCVVYLDLDGFKEVNDAYGHDVGDKLLQGVADRLGGTLADRHLALARLGGDEFVFVLSADPQGLYRAQIASVLEELQPAFRVGELQMQVGASLGVAVFPQDGADHGELLKSADLAMYAAKARGRNQIVYFEASLRSASSERIALRRELTLAQRRDELYLVYQPRVACADMRNHSAEALLRWNHPTRGNVPPDRFIPLAEEAGLIVDIGYWVLKQAMAQFRAWQAMGLRHLDRISVNLSPIQLTSEGFLETVESIVAASGVSPTAIEFEVTEGAFIKDLDDTVRKLDRLRAMGFQIALDDFGVGYSAMSYLSRLPFDTLKIDKSFVDGFGHQKSAYAIASAIVALGKALDKEVVAEGVETREQAELLIALGVDELQGYHYSRPLRPVDFETYMQQPESVR
jgi:diguanylate cyclase (GGDEF)-like protein